MGDYAAFVESEEETINPKVYKYSENISTKQKRLFHTKLTFSDVTRGVREDSERILNENQLEV